MLKDKKFFKFFWFCIRFCGLQPHKLNGKEKFRAFTTLVVLYVINFALLIVELLTTESVEIQIQGIQTIPTFIIMLIDIVNFMKKSKQIEELFDSLCKVIDESGNEKLFNESYKKTLTLVKILAGFAIISILINSVVFMITGKSGVPIYIPDNRMVFPLIYGVQLLFFIYCTLLITSLLDSFIFISFSMLNGYSKHLSKMFKDVSFDSDQFVKCFQDHLKFKQ